MNQKNKSVKVVAFASGSGSNFKSIHQKIKTGEINAEIKILVSNNLKAGVLAYASAEGIPIFIHNKTRFRSNAEYTDSLFNELNSSFSNSAFNKSMIPKGSYAVMFSG